MSDVAVDVNAYFERIGYVGSRSPTLDTLRRIHLHHPAAIPFENLDVLEQRPVRLDLTSLQHKLIASRRGGYCFEHNTLLAAVLRTLGFKVTTLAGRVRWNGPPDQVAPRTHMVLRVDLEEGPFLTDVGFGGLSLTGPLALNTTAEQVTPHEPHRIVGDGFRRMLQAKFEQVWKDVYEFTMEEHHPIDYELGNWYTSTHPGSRFRQHLLVGRVGAPGERFLLFNGEFTSRNSGAVVRRKLETPAEVAQILDTVFGLPCPSNLGSGFTP